MSRNQFFKIFQICALLLALTFGAAAQEAKTWQTFSPPNGAWTIFAPGVLSPDEEATEPQSLMGSYSYNDAKGFYSVIYRDTPKGKVLWKPLKTSHFKKVRKDFIKSNNGELLKEEKITVAGREGREVFIRVPESRFMTRESQIKPKYRVQRLRMFFDNRRFYLILAVLPEAEIDAAETNKFFDSFALK